jgi:hypothetical protein
MCLLHPEMTLGQKVNGQKSSAAECKILEKCQLVCLTQLEELGAWTFTVRATPDFTRPHHSTP